MDTKTMKPTNNQIEPDFLQFLIETFKKWQTLHDEEVHLGTREISKVSSMIEGAKLNAHIGFAYRFERGERQSDDQEIIALMIWANTNEMENGYDPIYEFIAEIY